LVSLVGIGRDRPTLLETACRCDRLTLLNCFNLIAGHLFKNRAVSVLNKGNRNACSPRARRTANAVQVRLQFARSVIVDNHLARRKDVVVCRGYTRERKQPVAPGWKHEDASEQVETSRRVAQLDHQHTNAISV
jgi:hypothetical protein